ncbi:MAG: sulfur carrier protein ThiS [Planctomycetaceae bacterium]
MRIVVNGDEREIATGATVRELLASLNIKTRAVAVERNLEIIPAARHAECCLCEGDRLEIVTLVGGG